ncbi:MAG TPA: DegT/DnrJ/EryC1/StrS family aminotransferase [Elusimicrobiota bacterium]|nr:DegT/DnrJ/EryC1/StrS family aminotransferase [Elusimicrobiota bacterium]
MNTQKNQSAVKPFGEIPVANVAITEEDAKAVYETVRAGWISMGPKVKEFEGCFSQYVGTKHAIAANNGTTALHTVLAALGIGPGDEVIVPSITFISTANVVLYQNATLKLAECDPMTYNIRPQDIEALITPKTKAIIPVDMNGLPVDFDSILDLARKRNITVIADSAESLGAVYKGKRIGSQCLVHIFSFFPNKNVTTGEGGMITTSDDSLADKIRVLRSQGQDYRYHHIELGYNYRMTDIQASLGIGQVRRLDEMLKEKQRVADIYTSAFSKFKNLKAPFIPKYVDKHSWYMYAISVADHIDRDKVVRGLKDRGIDTRLSFPPVHTQPYYQKRFGYTNDSLPVSYKAWSKLINIPMWPGLPMDKQQFVIDSLRELCDE